LALYSVQGMLLATAGHPLPARDPRQIASGWLGGHPPVFALKLPDGRWLLGAHNHPRGHAPGLGLTTALALIALAVGLASLPLVRRLTRRLERLQQSVEALGTGQLSTRVAVEGDDEVARLAASFNRSAAHIETLMQAQRNLLANASHELRSPLARIRMAIELLPADSPPNLRAELAHNIVELDQLVDEILLASRLEAGANMPQQRDAVALTAIAAEEAARVGATLPADDVVVQGDARLLRRLLRNLLENAQRHGGAGPISVALARQASGIEIQVCDRGPGVPADQREAIFEPFYRLPGSRERDGGSGLDLSLVRQIARHHGGDVHCTARDGGGSCFVVTLPG
ncbi:MAG: HAMP domain-containing histidine kinase, partial [Pseudomonadota bacterium]|nr:HAMP domain-containing histidine kinase [Pseudomonadota bacterium]